MRKGISVTLHKLKRMVCSGGFWISVLLIFIITISTEAHTHFDGSQYSLLTILFHFDEAARIQNNMSAQSKIILINAIFSMYGMLFASLAYASVLCEEQKYGVRRYMLMKEGRWTHILSNAFATMLASGLVFVVGSAVTEMFILWNYPLRSEVEGQAIVSWLEYNARYAPWLYATLGEMASFVQLLMGVFLYGMFCGFIGFICAAFFSNVYLLTCISFFFGYFYFSIAQSIEARVSEGSLPMEWLQSIQAYVSPNSYMRYWIYADSFFINILVLVLVWMVGIGIHKICMEKKADCGGV